MTETYNCGNVAFGDRDNSKESQLYVGVQETADLPADSRTKTYVLSLKDDGEEVIESVDTQAMNLKWKESDSFPVQDQEVPDPQDDGEAYLLLPWQEKSICWMFLTSDIANQCLTAHLTGCNLYLNTYEDGSTLLFHANASGVGDYDATQAYMDDLYQRAMEASGYTNPEKQTYLTRKEYEADLFADEPDQVIKNENQLCRDNDLIAYGHFANVFGEFDSDSNSWSLRCQSYENAAPKDNPEDLQAYFQIGKETVGIDVTLL